MISKRSSRKQFNSMFWQSVKKTCLFPIAAFVCLIGTTFFEQAQNARTSDLYSPASSYGFFWNQWTNGNAVLPLSAFIIAGILSAFLLFSFMSSKKQSNVIFSLGMTRKDIYASRYLAGMLPMLAVIVISTLIELMNVSAVGYGVHKQVVMMMIMVVLSFFSAYALPFTLTSAIISNSGNIFEGSVFTGITAAFPYVASYFVNYVPDSFTLGYFNAGIEGYWFDPFAYFNSISIKHYQYFDKIPNAAADKFTFNDFTGIIEAYALIAIIFTIGFFAFNKHKNEICGSWGRAKGLNEICAAFVGFYGFTAMVAFMNSNQNHGNGNFITYLMTCIAFLVCYLIIKMIFGYKRKKLIVSSLKRFPIYAVAFGAVMLVFSTGLFGYSSYVPKTEDISSVTVGSQLWNYKDVYNSSGSFWGLKSSFVSGYSLLDRYTDSSNAGITFYDSTGIKEVTNVHESLIEDGRIRNNASNACGNGFTVSYNLKNGDTVTRFYTETTEATSKKMIALNDLDDVKEDLKLSYDSAIELLSGNTGGITESGGMIDAGTGYEYSSYYSEHYYEDMYGIMNYVNKDVYLFGKDMIKGQSIGKLDKELLSAIETDLLAQSSQQSFYHSAQDELGVISVGLSYTNSMNYYTLNGGYINSNTGEIYDEYGNPTGKYSDDEYINADGSVTTSWNILSTDVKTYVITKDMTNTIKYFSDNDYLKYFESTTSVSDVKSVKVATMGELYSKASANLPRFYACYWMAETCKEYNENINYQPWGDIKRFESINNEITNKTTIQQILDSAFLSGYCGNDYRIVEITYNDGSVATKCITADAYKAILG